MIETLVVVSILALLLTILVPALRSARDQMKTLMCASNLKTAVLKFQLFAEGLSEGGRGRSEELGSRRFWADDYQALLYGADRFWDSGLLATVTLQNKSALMMCPAGPRELVKRRDVPFGPQAVGPPESISIGMNSRLYRAAIDTPDGSKTLAQKDATTIIGAEILNHPYVPLLFDIDGREAVKRGVTPYYSAPPVQDITDPYNDGVHWNPSRRHRGGTNVAFVGGHVQSSLRPSREAWDWEYQASIRESFAPPR